MSDPAEHTDPGSRAGRYIKCDCSCATRCPQGRLGSGTACVVWVEDRRLSPAERGLLRTGPVKVTPEVVEQAKALRAVSPRIPWKTICKKLGVGRTSLWEAIGGKNVRKLIAEHEDDSQTPRTSPLTVSNA